jgi:hypothetical protein
VSIRGGGTFKGWPWNLAVDERVRRPWWRSAIPGEGPTNMGKENAHEHRCATGKRSVYLGELEIKRRRLPMMRLGSTAPVKSSSGREQFRQRGGRDWTSSGRRASGGRWRSDWLKELGRGGGSTTNFGKGCTAAARC